MTCFSLRIFITAAVCIAILPARATDAADRNYSNQAMAYLSETLGDSRRAKTILPALRATGDGKLLAIFTALSRSGDKQLRMFATSAIAEIGGAEAGGILLERLWGDPAMAIRAEALVRLLDLKAISDEQLVRAMNISDQTVQSLAARALVRRGRAAAGAETLRKLTESSNLATSSMAKISLLGMGYEKYKPQLSKLVSDPNTPRSVLSLLMGQIGSAKISAAAGLARSVAESDRSVSIRVKAYRALCEVSPKGGAVLCEAAYKSKSTVLRVYLVGIIASKDANAPKHLKVLSTGPSPAAVLARFELARIKHDALAALAASEGLSMGHPIVVDYVLNKARLDVDKRKAAAGFYVEPLLEFVGNVNADTSKMGTEHIRAATAVTILTDLGSPKAVEGIRRILAGRYNAITRAAAAGLMRSKNRAACELARPLLKSPYQELSADAALVLGKFSDVGAIEYLGEIVSRPKNHQPAMVAMASWYLLAISGKADSGAKTLAAQIR